jgi:hypothetical protein
MDMSTQRHPQRPKLKSTMSSKSNRSKSPAKSSKTKPTATPTATATATTSEPSSPILAWLSILTFAVLLLFGSQTAAVVHGFDALKSAKLLSSAFLLNLAWLDLVKGINACAQYRRVSPQTGRLEALVACVFLRTVGNTLQSIALGTALSWTYSTSAVPTVVVAWLAICCTPLDTVLAFLSRPNVRIVLDLLQCLATAHTITTSAMDAVFVAPGLSSPLSPRCSLPVLLRYGSRVLGDYFNISEPPGSASIAWVPDHVPVDFVSPSPTVRRATFCAVLYLLLRNVHNIVPFDPWFWLLPGTRDSALIASGASARFVVVSVLLARRCSTRATAGLCFNRRSQKRIKRASTLAANNEE